MPLKLKVKAFDLRFDPKKFTESFQKKAEIQIRNCLREALREIIKDGLPPVLSGEARGSLIPLGRLLRVAVPVNPKAGQPNGTAKGESQAIPLEIAFTKRGVRVSFGTTVPHYVFLDTQGRPAGAKTQVPAPWGSFEKMTAVFKACILEKLPELVPDKNKFLTKNFVVGPK